MATITKRGERAWRVRIRIGGEYLNKTLDTEAEARAWAAREEARMIDGETAAQVRRMPSTITIPELFERYALEVSPTHAGCRWEVIRLRALSRTLTMPALEVDGAALAEWRDARLRQVSASSVNRELNLISAVFSRAIKEWRLPMAVNPAHNIMWPKKPHPRKRRVSHAERAAIIEALGWDGVAPPVETRQFVAWAFCLALETMMRKSEILRLTWEHVHLDRRFVHLPRTKNGHPRNVPLSSRAAALIRLLTNAGPDNLLVDVNEGTFGVYFRRAQDKAGVTDMHFHDTRREALTQISKKITNIAELARASGHRGIASLMIYYEPDVEEIAGKMD